MTVIAWRALEYSPGNLAITEGLERHVNKDVANLMQGGFSLGDADEIRLLMNESGFRDISIRPETKTAHFPSVEEFLRRLIMGLAVGRAGISLDDDLFDALIQDASQALEPYVDGSRLSFPMSAHIYVASK